MVGQTADLEALSLLPPYEGKSVLQIGAGIGPLTGELAKKAGQVLAVDFTRSVTNKSESISGNHPNVKFISADVTSPSLDISPESFDLIFANSFLVHVSDDEVGKMVQNIVNWLKPGGFLFLREACSNDSVDQNQNNSIHYRDPKFYTKVFKECRVQSESGNSYELSVVGGKCNQYKVLDASDAL